MSADTRSASGLAPANLLGLEEIYKDLHAHPELSMQEHRTAGIAGVWLRGLGYEVTENVGGTGVVGILRNGDGPTVLLRADMDGLPMRESTNLPYSSEATGTDRFGQKVAIAHSCGHDLHVTWLMGVTRTLAEDRGSWRGTVMAVFQPGEETAQGARAMIEDGMVKRFPKPDVTLGQHVVPLRAGLIGHRAGPIMAAADSWEVKLFGRGGHGSMPQRTIDPIVMAASTVMRLQTVVSREIGMTDSAVVTVGALHAGTSENIIPDSAILRLNIRTYDGAVRDRVLAAVRRIVEAEAGASGATRMPEFSVLSEYPMTTNEAVATRKVVTAFERSLGASDLMEIGPAPASEDFGLFATTWGVPSVFWVVGGADPDTFQKAAQTGKLHEIPGNHHPGFAPVLASTLGAGVEAMLSAARAWLSVDESKG